MLGHPLVDAVGIERLGESGRGSTRVSRRMSDWMLVGDISGNDAWYTRRQSSSSSTASTHSPPRPASAWWKPPTPANRSMKRNDGIELLFAMAAELTSLLATGGGSPNMAPMRR